MKMFSFDHYLISFGIKNNNNDSNNNMIIHNKNQIDIVFDLISLLMTYLNVISIRFLFSKSIRIEFLLYFSHLSWSKTKREREKERKKCFISLRWFVFFKWKNSEISFDFVSTWFDFQIDAFRNSLYD